MNYFAGLDVSVKNTSVCIVDEMGKIVREVKVVSEPEALLVVLKNLAYAVSVALPSSGVLVLRHQLNVLRRKRPKRVVFSNIDRLVFAGLYRLAPGVLEL
jgi:hypothetical protein